MLYMVSFPFALTVAEILKEICILLALLAGCSRKHFLWNVMSLFHISECLRLELRGNNPFSVNMKYFSPYCFPHETWVKLNLYI